MSLNAKIENALNRLSLTGDPAAGPLVVDVNGGTLKAGITAVDQLACAFERFAYRNNRLADHSIEQLKELAERLSSQLSYLLESISPVEVDEQACVVQMRSNPPQRDDDGTRYYELVARRGELSLCRYSKAPGQQRQVVPAHVTREVLTRLATDFVRAID